jgi:uncharacterized membrane protein
MATKPDKRIRLFGGYFLAAGVIPLAGYSLIQSHRGNVAWQLVVAGIVAAGLVGVVYRFSRLSQAAQSGTAAIGPDQGTKTRGAFAGYVAGVAVAVILFFLPKH